MTKTERDGTYSHFSGFREVESYDYHAYVPGYHAEYRQAGRRVEMFMSKGAADSPLARVDPIAGQIIRLVVVASEMSCSRSSVEQRSELLPIFVDMYREARSVAKFPEHLTIANKLCEQMQSTQFPASGQGTYFAGDSFLRTVEPSCLDPIDDSREKAIVAAIGRNDPEPIRRAAATGFDLNRTIAMPWTSLDAAAYQNADRVVAALIAAGADVNRGRPFYIALQRSPSPERLRILRMMLEAGVDPNRPGPRENWNDGITPLALAGQNGDVETFNLLLEFGARINERSQCVQYYCRSPERIVLHYLNDPKIVRIALDRGADATSVTGDGQTVLRGRSSPETVRMLLEHGADPNFVPTGGYPLLMGVVKLTAEPNPPYGRSLADYLSNTRAVAEILVAGCARIDTIDRDGHDPLSYTQDEAWKSRLREIAATANCKH